MNSAGTTQFLNRRQAQYMRDTIRAQVLPERVKRYEAHDGEAEGDVRSYRVLVTTTGMGWHCVTKYAPHEYEEAKKCARAIEASMNLLLRAAWPADYGKKPRKLSAQTESEWSR